MLEQSKKHHLNFCTAVPLCVWNVLYGWFFGFRCCCLTAILPSISLHFCLQSFFPYLNLNSSQYWKGYEKSTKLLQIALPCLHFYIRIKIWVIFGLINLLSICCKLWERCRTKKRCWCSFCFVKCIHSVTNGNVFI